MFFLQFLVRQQERNNKTPGDLTGLIPTN